MAWKLEEEFLETPRTQGTNTAWHAQVHAIFQTVRALLWALLLLFLINYMFLGHGQRFSDLFQRWNSNKQSGLIDSAQEQMNENNKKINNSDDFDFYWQSLNKIHGVCGPGRG